MGHLPKTQTQLYSDLNTTNNNLSQFQIGGSVNNKNIIIRKKDNDSDFTQLYATEDMLEFGSQVNGVWKSIWKAALKADLSDRAKKFSANFTSGNTVLDVSSWSVITLLSIVTYKDESTALYLIRKESSSKIYYIPVKSSTQVSVTYNGENKLILTNSATYGGTYTVLFLS